MLKLYCTKANQKPAEEIAHALHLPLQICTTKIFSSTEKLLSSDNIETNSHGIIIHELWPSFEHQIIELLLLLDVLAANRLTSITLITPYIPYLRQDRELNEYSSIGSRMLGQLFENTIIKKIITIDAHSEEAIKFFKQEFINLSCAEFFANKLKIIGFSSNSLIISPDKGSLLRANELSKLLNLPYIALNKKREEKTVITSGFGNSQHYHSIIIIDDIIDSGATISSTINTIKDNTEQIFICVSHIINPNVIEHLRLLHQHIHVITTNSTNYKNKITFENIWEVIIQYLR